MLLPSDDYRPEARSSVPVQDAKNGFFQSWYPVALSSEVAAGQVVSKHFLDGKIAVFRGANGVASVVSAYCRHLGTDLGLGKVVGDNLRCPYHHWAYNQSGKCTMVPFDSAPENTSLFKFPTHEAFGLIWAFNGEEPLFDFPGITGFSEESVAYRIADLGVWPVEPWVMTTNSFDVSHGKALHAMKVTEDPAELTLHKHHITWFLDTDHRDYGPHRVSIILHGSNLVTLSNVRNNGDISVTFSALAPVGRNSMQYYLISAVPLKEGEKADDPVIQSQISELESYIITIVEEDRSIMENIRFTDDTLLNSDSYIASYLSWLKTYPRAHPSQRFIS